MCSRVSNWFHSCLLCIKVLNPISVLEKGYLLRKEPSLSCDTEPHLLLSFLFHLRLHILNCIWLSCNTHFSVSGLPSFTSKGRGTISRKHNDLFWLGTGELIYWKRGWPAQSYQFACAKFSSSGTMSTMKLHAATGAYCLFKDHLRYMREK